MGLSMAADAAPCPCGSGRALDRCCGRWYSGAPAQTAEALMRARYTAFVRRDEAYLLATWHPRTRPPRIVFEPTQKWLGLNIRATSMGGQADGTGVVEFVARFRIGNRAYRLHEVSRFERMAGRWCYVDGDRID